jgi:hypothetical protein
MNVAICLSGAIKFIDNGLITLNKICNLYNTKLFIHSWEIENFAQFNSTSWTSIQYNFDYSIYHQNNIFNKYNYTDIEIENYDNKKIYLEEIFNNFKFENYGQRNDIGLISMFYSIYKSNMLKIKYEKDNNVEFDCVIRMRSDSLLINNIALEEYDMNNLNIPSGRDWGGLNDQFAFGNSNVMNLYSETFNNIKKIHRNVYHPETILKQSIELYDINIDRPNIEISINNG